MTPADVPTPDAILAAGDALVGVAIVGRPVAAAFNDGETLEVNRTCVADDVPNGNSMLYGAAWRAAKALGYRRLVTYTQEGETGASLRAAGWRVIAERPARHGVGWGNRPRRKTADGIARTLWEACGCGSPHQYDWRDARVVLAAVCGDIVEAARREVLTEALAEIEAVDNSDDPWIRQGASVAARIVTDLRDRHGDSRPPRDAQSDVGAESTPTGEPAKSETLSGGTS